MKLKTVREIFTGEIKRVSYEEAQILVGSGFYRTSSKSKGKSQLKKEGKKVFQK